MPLRVKLQEIVEAIDLPNRDWQSYPDGVDEIHVSCARAHVA